MRSATKRTRQADRRLGVMGVEVVPRQVHSEGWDISGGTLGGEPIGLANVMALLGELRIGLGVEPPGTRWGLRSTSF